MAETLPKKLNLEIVTPSDQLFAGEVDSVTLPGIEGYLGILPGHAPLLSELKAGIITYSKEGKEHRLFCGWGFVEVLPGDVSVLAEVAELPEDIDAEKASRTKSEAEALLRSKSPDTDFAGAMEQWEASVARLEVLSQR